MEVTYHPSIPKDLRSALDYYESEGGRVLGDRFFEKVEEAVARVLANPEGFHFEAEGLRRAALMSFPCHFLYEVDLTHVRFLVLRHDKRHPGFGLGRR